LSVSEHADANGWVGFSYDDVNGITTVTDSLGHATQYHYAALFGVRHVTTTVGGPCDACGANAAHFTYDANGFVSSQTDFNGNITSYQRDAQGRELSRTEASGTPEARTVTTTWDTALNKPLTIEEPGRRMTYSYDTTGKVLSSTIEPVP
jgi:YD repeat-containing protein